MNNRALAHENSLATLCRLHWYVHVRFWPIAFHDDETRRGYLDAFWVGFIRLTTTHTFPVHFVAHNLNGRANICG